jgi:hypothetical protein
MIWGLIVVLVAGLLILTVISRGSSPAKQRSGKGSHSSQRVGSLDREFVARKWAAIESMKAAGNGSSLRDAVSEADKLLDYALKQTGARGETMGERLKNSGSRFSDLDAIWQAHKLRNALAHEADFDLVASQAREAVQDFERGLHDLGAL